MGVQLVEGLVDREIARDQSASGDQRHLCAYRNCAVAQAFQGPPRLGLQQFGQSSEPLGLPVGGKPGQRIPDFGHETNVDGRRALASQVPRQPVLIGVSLFTPAELLNQERVSRSLRRRLGQNPGVVDEKLAAQRPAFDQMFR